MLKLQRRVRCSVISLQGASVPDAPESPEWLAPGAGARAGGRALGEAGPVAWDQGLGGGFWEDEHERAGCGTSELTVRPWVPAWPRREDGPISQMRKMKSPRPAGPQSSGSHHCARRAVGAGLSPLWVLLRLQALRVGFWFRRSRSRLSGALRSAVQPFSPESVLPALTLPSWPHSFPLFRVTFLRQQHCTSSLSNPLQTSLGAAAPPPPVYHVLVTPSSPHSRSRCQDGGQLLPLQGFRTTGSLVVATPPGLVTLYGGDWGHPTVRFLPIRLGVENSYVWPMGTQ